MSAHIKKLGWLALGAGTYLTLAVGASWAATTLGVSVEMAFAVGATAPVALLVVVVMGLAIREAW